MTKRYLVIRIPLDVDLTRKERKALRGIFISFLKCLYFGIKLHKNDTLSYFLKERLNETEKNRLVGILSSLFRKEQP